MPFCWLIGISYSLRSKSAMRCWSTRTSRSWESWSWSEKPVRRDGLQAAEKASVGLVALGDGGERVLGELVVVAIVAESRGALGKVAQVGLVLLFEKGVLGGEAVGNWFEVLGEDGSSYDHKEK